MLPGFEPRRNGALVALALSSAVLAPWGRSHAYIEAPMSLGSIIEQSHHVVVLELEQVDTQRNTLHFRKVRDLKGRHPTDRVTQHIGQQGFHPREWQTVMQWAQPGKTAVFFHNGRASETCIDGYWYQCYGWGADWRMSHAEPYLLRSYAGPAERLTQIVEKVARGEEAEAPCMVDGDKDDLQFGRARIQRLRVSLDRIDYDPERDFAGWGGGEIEEVLDMPGFTHWVPLGRIDPLATGASATDYDGDGRVDVCLFGEARVALFHHEEKTYQEVPLPVEGGARSAQWADCDGDGFPDLLLATPAGPRLFAGTGRKDAFRELTSRLGLGPPWNLTAAAWVDADGDGDPDVLLANGFYGLRLLWNESQVAGGPAFRDGGSVAVPAGLLEAGGAGAVKGDHLVLGDLDGDGRCDALYCAGRGVVLLGNGSGFSAMTDSGLELEHGGVGPALGDFDADGDLDVFLPSRQLGRLFENDGRGRFREVTARALGGIDPFGGEATAAGWGDFDGDGFLDLFIARRRSFHRLLRNRGDGTFGDWTVETGLDRRVFDSQSACLGDMDGDGDLDLLLANEGRDSCILLGRSDPVSGRTRVEVVLADARQWMGTRLSISAAGSARAEAPVHELGGLGGRGSQGPPRIQLALPPGDYVLDVRYTNGQVGRQELRVRHAPFLVEVGG